jgi:superfamily II DNA or RNA helicase
MPDSRQLEAAIWAIADGRASDADHELFRVDENDSLVLLDRLIVEAEDDIDSVRHLRGDERDQVLADFVDTLQNLTRTAAILRPLPEALLAAVGAEVRRIDGGSSAAFDEFDDLAYEELTSEPLQLQATWSAGHVVVWGAARGAAPESFDALAARLERIGGPPIGWLVHKGVPLPGGQRADALSISLRDALGWLVAAGGGEDSDGVGPSVRWLGHVALEGVRLAARGSVVPSLRVGQKPENGQSNANVRWVPALIDSPAVDALIGCMPPPVVALGGGDARVTAHSVITAVVEAIVAEAIERMDLPASPPTANTAIDLNDTIIARMDGSGFRAPVNLAADQARRLDQWARGVTSMHRKKLVVQLDAPDAGGVWLVTVRAPAGKGRLAPLEAAMRSDPGGTLSAEYTRLTRLFPALDRPGTRRRGQVALSQDEAWQFMTVTGPTLSDIGFDVRVPPVSRKKPRPSLRLFAEAPAGSVVGAHQLSNVAWTVLFDDLELTAAEVQQLARQARPLVQAGGKWVEVDKLDLEKAAAALAERASITSLTGAEILRHSIGLDGSGLAGGTVVHGDSWANELFRKASEASALPEHRPEGFVGELRHYQAEALGWLAFLESAELGGCLALDMGLGKTPTVLAHLARRQGDGPALVVAPAAVVGNWAAEAARFAPGLRVVIHHGANRAEEDELAAQIARADVVITTYATAVRDVEELVATTWGRIVLDEAQAIKNPTSDTAQQLRRLSARTRLCLTGTPIENGLGDLWAILDFTNPGLVGSRPAFVAQMSGTGEEALRALNGILLFRRTKSEPEVAKELPDKIDELDHCTMTPEQIGLYQAVLDTLVNDVETETGELKQGAILAAITALKQICNHPAAYRDDGLPLSGRSGKLARLEEIVHAVFAANERVLVFTHFASWGRRLAEHLTEVTGKPVACYDGSLARGVRDRLVSEFQQGEGAGAMVLSLKAGGTGLNLTAANHVVLYDRWWNPAVEDQARDRAWRIGQRKTVISHRLVCPGTVDERVEEVVAGKRHIANLVLPKSSSLADLSTDQLRVALGLRPEELLAGDDE